MQQSVAERRQRYAKNARVRVSETWKQHSPNSEACRRFIGGWEATWNQRWELRAGRYYPKTRAEKKP